MSMMGDIAIESTVLQMVIKIKEEIEKNKKKPAVVASLKKIGRHALTLFDYSTPDWSDEYEKFFKD